MTLSKLPLTGEPKDAGIFMPEATSPDDELGDRYVRDQLGFVDDGEDKSGRADQDSAFRVPVAHEPGRSGIG